MNAHDGSLSAQGDTWPARAWIGNWHVRRKLIDFSGGASCVFSGQATVTETAFSESGEVRIGGRILTASRSYRLEVRDGSVLVFRGSDAFISLDGQPSQIARHQCGADLYSGRFFFRGIDEWAEAWRVKGPRKNYASLSQFRRLGA
ncbi:DUF6314 family protein [Mesorhizobium sp. INR15]|uniref:DUF6314 family protein n=1 Tax=Mesorhizobium sp. INR15 TaxID=2654248 RepID=UPI0018966A37|nr:DUF6314 family protein [Mesorhizobium sp. INR15]QPC91833.1 hypothetical protein GA829_15230 [Mesorhizobium sp. INR15]